MLSIQTLVINGFPAIDEKDIFDSFHIVKLFIVLIIVRFNDTNTLYLVNYRVISVSDSVDAL